MLEVIDPISLLLGRQGARSSQGFRAMKAEKLKHPHYVWAKTLVPAVTAAHSDHVGRDCWCLLHQVISVDHYSGPRPLLEQRLEMLGLVQDGWKLAARSGITDHQTIPSIEIHASFAQA
jgi:hypothetical protein